MRKDKKKQQPKVQVKRTVSEKDVIPNYWEQMTDEDIEVMKEVEEEEEESIYDLSVSHIINTYQRCTRLHVLPKSGGLDDQTPFFLECFDIVSDEVSKYESELARSNH